MWTRDPACKALCTADNTRSTCSGGEFWIRDFMAGDLLSGTCRAGEAIFLVGGVAIGIATVLGILYL